MDYGSSELCRLSPGPQFLPLSSFGSVACAHCLFYIYFLTPPYSQNYNTKICGSSGLLICPKYEQPIESQNYRFKGDQFGEFDSSLGVKNCSCEQSPHRIYNLQEYSKNGSSRPLEDLYLQPNLPPDFAIIVRQCCEAALKCCTLMLKNAEAEKISNKKNEVFWTSFFSTSNNEDVDYLRSSKENESFGGIIGLSNSNKRFCPATWDGWQCFGRAEPGEVLAKCPNYIFGDRLRNDIGVHIVKKICLPNGDWYSVIRGSDSPSTEWTDYSGCVANSAYALKLFAGLIAFTITVIAIIPALFVISLHRLLKNQPVFIIHRQLLYSFLFFGFFYIFNCLFFAIDGAPGDYLYFNNHISCRFLFTIQLRYFRLSTFSWMLAEGVYLYRLLMCTFSTGEEPLRPYFISCWGVPLIVSIIYAILRQTFDNEECWIKPTVWWIEWTIIMPCVFCLCINLLLMLVIFCVLLKKLRCNPNLEPAQYTKAVRAVFMLVPVFGLHFLITIYRIQSYAHQIANLVLDGLQGFVVALIVCYTNKTVLECIRNWIQQRKEERKLRRQSDDHKLRFKRSLMMQKTENQLTLPIIELKSNCDANNNNNEQSSSKIKNLSKL